MTSIEQEGVHAKSVTALIDDEQWIITSPDDGREIERRVYARRPAYYVVYRSEYGTSVAYLDHSEREDLLRSRIAPLARLRGEIGGLLQASRSSARGRAQLWVAQYDRRVADALVIALDGDTRSATELLVDIRSDLVAERESRSRLVSLGTAAGAAIALAVVAMSVVEAGVNALAGISRSIAPNLALACVAGSVGAFFSIGIGASSRHIRAGARPRETAADSSFRIAIGALTALVLQLVLESGLLSIRLGGMTFGNVPGPAGAGGPMPGVWPQTVILGFLAGFAERLVPDLLGRARGAAGDARATVAAALSDPAAAVQEIERAVRVATRAALSGPELTRFEGYVAVDVAWPAEPGDKRTAALTLRFLREPVEGAATLAVREGVAAPQAQFVVECEPEGSPRNLVSRTFDVPTDRPFQAAPITLNVPPETSMVWVQIFQHNRLLQTIGVPMPDMPAKPSSPE